MEENQPNQGQSGMQAQQWVRKLMEPKRALAVAVLAVVAYVVIVSILSLFNSVTGVSQGGVSVTKSDMAYDSYGISREATNYAVPTAPGPEPFPQGSGGVGDYDEQTYEARQYTATIKTGEYERVCSTIESWKPRADVMFEQVTRGETSASYRFKVTQQSAGALLAELQKLEPSDLTEQTEVVKKQLLLYTSELDVLQKREALLTETLDTVNSTYDELVALSKNANDVKTLANVIDDKLKYMQQLANQRIEVSRQIDAIAERKAELVDRIEYVTFYVTVQKYHILDTDGMKDSWVHALRVLAINANDTLQALTIGLLTFLLLLVKVVFFGLIVLVLVKYGWGMALRLWKS